jgi:hypothetical protein
MIEDLIRYCQPRDKLPDLTGSKSGSILIIGSAVCVKDDLARYDHLHAGERMAVNDMIPAYKGKLDHVASLHPDKLYFWCKARPDKPIVHLSHRAGGWPDTVWPLHADGATSGLFAVIISLLMGFDSIVLAGIPVSDEVKITGEVGKIGAEVMQKEWLIFSKFFGGKVKSLSGWTREKFGEPI